MLVLCHSFLHHAFCVYKPLNSQLYKLWLSSLFIANLIIERQAELPEGSSFAITSKQVFESFALKFHGSRPSVKQKETVDILRNSIYVVESPSINALSLDDGVFVICDTLYSRSSYEPILISNIPKKMQKAEEFYHKKDPRAKIPYPVCNAIVTEAFLRGRFPEWSKIVDQRIKNSVMKIF